MNEKGQNSEIQSSSKQGTIADFNNFVLEKSIFSNIFDKDIRRVYIYKKAERLAKAIHLVAPAFATSPALKDRIDAVAVALIDAAIVPPSESRELLSRELLALSSVLAIARTTSLLSSMNAELIAHEAHELLQEVASYDEPRLFLDPVPTIAELAKTVAQKPAQASKVFEKPESKTAKAANLSIGQNKGHSIGQIADTGVKSGRRDSILSVLRAKGPVYIKDISTVIRDVSEKTIQRELQSLVEEGAVSRTGERRWTSYSLAS
jgi:DNA-binding transcriptional ArsR family regulator